MAADHPPLDGQLGHWGMRLGYPESPRDLSDHHSRELRLTASGACLLGAIVAISVRFNLRGEEGSGNVKLVAFGGKSDRQVREGSGTSRHTSGARGAASALHGGVDDTGYFPGVVTVLASQASGNVTSNFAENRDTPFFEMCFYYWSITHVGS